MKQTYFIEEKTFEKIDFKVSPLQKGEYEYCTFINCDFSNTNLSEFRFMECEFIDCNLSLIKLTKTAFQDVKFRNNKMLGLQFDTCNEFGLSFSFDSCILNHSSFYQTKLKNTLFKESQLHEVDFTESDLTGSFFDNCDLMGATFDNTIIKNADLRTSYNYSINPDTNQIKKAKFSLPAVIGLLDKYDIKIE